MNKLSLLLLSLTTLLYSSCGDDENEQPAYSFKNQTVSGKIENTSWIYGDGYASIYGMGEDSDLHIDLFVDAEGEGCEAQVEGDRVFFTVPSKVGLYKLSLDFNNPEVSQTVTLLEDEDVMNYIATEGAIEITAITETTISGRIDARVDVENSVNGNFTVNICQ